MELPIIGEFNLVGKGGEFLGNNKIFTMGIENFLVWKAIFVMDLESDNLENFLYIFKNLVNFLDFISTTRWDLSEIQTTVAWITIAEEEESSTGMAQFSEIDSWFASTVLSSSVFLEKLKPFGISGNIWVSLNVCFSFH